jgi:peptidoglycan hydrolase-like protein with peptidoglycan-binding domain
VSEFKVSVGDIVKQGQVVALTGGGEEDKGKGNSKGPHLHFELYLNGKNVNPEDYLGSTVSTPDFSSGGSNGSSKVLDELLENADKSGFLIKLKDLAKSEKKLSNQSREGSRITYDEDVERMQIGLQFLGHSLPVWGIDGLFGPETENAVTSFQKESELEETGVMGNKDLQYLYATLVLKGFEEADLSKINFKGGYNDDILDVSPNAISADFEAMTKIIVNNIEGGYYNPEWHRQAAMGRSGETMFGMDRVHGSGLFKSGAGKKFWETIDKNKNKDVWKHYYRGGSLEPELLRLVTEIMTKHYEELSDRFLSDKAKKLVESNNGLKLHFYYASWNGSGFFQQFAKKINQAVDDGIESPEKLLSIAINSRLDIPSMKKSGEKLLKIFNSNTIA